MFRFFSNVSGAEARMDQYLYKDQKIRYDLLDSVRGICILGMVIYHTLFDVFTLHGTEMRGGWFTALDAMRDLGAAIFIFLSGVCFHFSTRRLRRFLILSAAGAAVTVITSLFVPENVVIFGILTFMGISGGILSLLERFLCRIPPLIGFTVSILFFALLFKVNYGYIGFFGLKISAIPICLYKNYFSAFIGFPFDGFSSGDYYPLLPWICACFAGYFFFPLLKKKSECMEILQLKIGVLSGIGKYSLPIYLLHQPVIFAVVSFIFYFTDH